MTALRLEALLDRLASLGGSVRLEGERVLVRPANLPADLMAALRAHKAELRSHLIASRYGVALAELRAIAGRDWPQLEADPGLLAAFAEAVALRKLRERGEVPPHYTAVTTCRHCGPVPIFPGCPPEVFGCPWCFNRIEGRPVPRIRHRLDEPGRRRREWPDLVFPSSS